MDKNTKFRIDLEKSFSPTVLFLLWVLVFLFETGSVMADTPDAFEPDNSAAKAKSIISTPNPEDPKQLHTFHTFFDEDWVIFLAGENTVYDITAGDPSAECDPVIELYRYDGTSLLRKSDLYGPGETETLTWRSIEADIYYIRFTNNSAHYGPGTEYTVLLTNPPTFRTPGYVIGRVTSGGVGVAGARLTADNGTAISKSDGSYIISLFEGTYNVLASKNGYNNTYFEVSIKENQTIRRDVELTPPPTPNRPPIISGIPDTSVFRNFLYSFKPTASDPDGDSITFSISNKPEWAHFNPDNGMLAGIPTVTDIGIHDAIVITVTDSHGKSASLAPFSLDVKILASPGIYMLLEGKD